MIVVCAVIQALQFLLGRQLVEYFRPIFEDVATGTWTCAIAPTLCKLESNALGFEGSE
jgi:hypothetical protein